MLYYCVYIGTTNNAREEQLLNERGRKREIHPQISRFTLVSMNLEFERVIESLNLSAMLIKLSIV